MAVLSAHDVERFTPDRYLIDGEVPPGVPVYLVAGMNWKERAKWRARLALEGVRYPPDAEMLRAVRGAIAEANPSNADTLLDHVQGFEDLLALPPVPAPNDSDDEAVKADQEAERERRLVIVRAYEAIVDPLRQHSSVGMLLSLRTLFFEVVPPLAAAFCLRGWENIEAKFQRVNGVVPDDVLDAIPFEDLMAVGNRALELQSVSAAQRGN